MIEVTLRYDGGLADKHRLNFYDAAHALVGFERSLSLVTHFVINGEIITQAPALKGARIFTEAPEDGSWKVVALISVGLLNIGSVGKDSPVGYAVTSMFDYVMHSTMGFHPDYNKTIQQQLAEHRSSNALSHGKLKSLVEKCERSVADMHRPIVASKTATKASTFGCVNKGDALIKLGPDMNAITYDYLIDERRSDQIEALQVKLSSYNINTFKGRVFVISEGRTIPFELTDLSKTPKQTSHITRSLRLNNANKKDESSIINITAYRVESRNGRLKHMNVIGVES